MQHNLIAYSDSMMSPSVRQILMRACALSAAWWIRIQPKVMSVGGKASRQRFGPMPVRFSLMVSIR
ncbi:hypothetical protein [Segatella oris]|uniref:hypothetical protein n=1 Tax=Segatella oris TaxID=28135 RepID=UPI00360E711F